jgi:hypothetical protein
VSAAVAVLVTVLLMHHKNHDATITGCVRSSAAGMSLTDEVDKRTYSLTGNTAAVKTGDRVTLEGKLHKARGATFVFDAHRVSRDFGACHP